MVSASSSNIDVKQPISSQFKIKSLESNLKPGPSHTSQSDQDFYASDSFNSPMPPSSGSMSATSQSPIPRERSSSNQSGTYAPTQKLICPVCHISVSTLTQLNKHIDKEHMEDILSDNGSDINSYSEEDVSETIFNWFRSAHQKVIAPLSKKTPNLSQLQKLAQGNHPDIVFNTHLKENQSIINREAITNSELKKSNSQVDSNVSLITTAHFKNLNSATKCSHKKCQKNFGLLTSKVNCQSCGEVFCEEHRSLQMRLNQQARPDPVKGFWGNVCRRCFLSKAIFHDESPPVFRDHFSSFKAARDKIVDRRQLEANKLTARLERLAKVPGGPSGPAAKTVVAWQPDSEASQCPHCKLVFRPLIRRKHHCRLCGRVVCGEASCMSKVPIEAILKNGPSPQTDILVCVECRSLVNRRQKHTKKPQVVVLYSQLRNYQKTIETHLPKFNDLILTLKSKESIHGNDSDVKQASLLRQELLEAFSQFDALRGRLQHLNEPPGLPSRLKTALCTAAVQFLQTNTVSLAALPRLLAPKPDNKSATPVISTVKLDPTIYIAPPGISMQLNVFLEQQANLELQLAEATSHRRLDDVRILTEALKSIREEIDFVKSQSIPTDKINQN